jgi:hypothetical protein
MALTEDLGMFLADFGVTCVAGAVTANGILDTPSQVISDGMVLTTDYTKKHERRSKYKQPRKLGGN